MLQTGQKYVDKCLKVTYNSYIKDNESEVNTLSEEKKKLIEETVENLKQMDKESLMIIRTGSEMLKARDAMDSKETEDKIDKKAC